MLFNGRREILTGAIGGLAGPRLGGDRHAEGAGNGNR